MAAFLVGSFLLIVGLFSSACLAQDESQAEAEDVRLMFVVSVPADTPVDDTLYISGNIPSLGNWNGQGLKLQRQDDGPYAASLMVKRGTQIECKVTRGSWQTVEKNASGGEMDNRLVVADKSKQVQFAVAAWANQQASQIKPTLTGNIKKHERFRSQILNNERTLIVYLPPGYDEQAERKYPVLYMHDGQNIFDASTSFAGVEWRVDEAAQRLINEGKIEPIIIVGLYNNADRMQEYNAGDPEGEPTAYARFVVEEVKPFIEKTYRVDSDSDKTGVAGSSMGGLISLYLVQQYPEVFGRCGIVSPALGIHDRQYLDGLLSADVQWMRGKRFWLDMGTAEAGSSTGNLLLRHTRDLAGLFGKTRQIHPDWGISCEYQEIEGGRHNEWAWSERIESILTCLYGL